MTRIVRCALIQTACELTPQFVPLEKIKSEMLAKLHRQIAEAAGRGAQIVCLQELATSPYFCAERDSRWHEFAEEIPDGLTISALRQVARTHGIVLIVPIYERAEGRYFNTAAVLDADGTYLGKYRKAHIPCIEPGYAETFYFEPGDLGYPVFDTHFAKVGVYICYDRHFPEGARLLGLNGAEIVFIPSATCGHSTHLWDLEQRALAVANEYFVGTVNRIGCEMPWKIGDFYGRSYFCDPAGVVLAMGSATQEDIVTADLDLDVIEKLRSYWQFYQDRRPDTYGPLAAARAGQTGE